LRNKVVFDKVLRLHITCGSSFSVHLTQWFLTFFSCCYPIKVPLACSKKLAVAGRQSGGKVLYRQMHGICLDKFVIFLNKNAIKA